MVRTPPTIRPGEAVLQLADAHNRAVAGAKAAALARAHRAGMPVLPGFVLTPDAALAVAYGGADDIIRVACQAWTELTQGGNRALVVRSSSTVEDGVDSSMAGRFRSVLDVRGWDGFIDAVRDVVTSGEAVREGEPGDVMAVLVQPFLVPEVGGVMFGADPVSGRRDRFVIAAVSGGPHQLVSGEVDGVTLTLTAGGKVVESTGTIPAVDANLRALVPLQKRARAVFGGPQDVEWAIVNDESSCCRAGRSPRRAPTMRRSARSSVLVPLPRRSPARSRRSSTTSGSSRWRKRSGKCSALTGAQPAKKLARSPVIVSVGGRSRGRPGAARRRAAAR